MPLRPLVVVAKSLRDLHQVPKMTVQAKKKALFRPPYHTVSLDSQIKNLRFRPKFKTIHKVHMAPCKPKKQYGRKNNLRHF